MLWLVNGTWREEGRVVWEVWRRAGGCRARSEQIGVLVNRDNGKGRSVLSLLSTGIVAHLVMGGARLKLKRGVDLAAGTSSSEDQGGSTIRNSAHFAKGLGKTQTTRTESLTAQ